MSWYTVNDAAKRLNISPGAVRARIHRKTLDTKKYDGATYVWVTEEDTPHNTSVEDELRVQVQLLRDQLAESKQSERELRRIVAIQAQNQPAIEATERNSPPESSSSTGEAERSTHEPQTVGFLEGLRHWIRGEKK